MSDDRVAWITGGRPRRIGWHWRWRIYAAAFWLFLFIGVLSGQTDGTF